MGGYSPPCRPPGYATGSTVPGRSLPVIFSFLRIGQLGWVVLGVPAKTLIRPSGAPRIFKEGRRKFFLKEILSPPNFWPFFTENRGFHAIFRQNLPNFVLVC